MITTSIVQIDVRMSNPQCEFINDNADGYAHVIDYLMLVYYVLMCM